MPRIQPGASTSLPNVTAKNRVMDSNPSNKPPMKIKLVCCTLGIGAKYARNLGGRKIDPFQQQYRCHKPSIAQNASSPDISPGNAASWPAVAGPDLAFGSGVGNSA